jgi:sugar phosphate permease
LRRTPLQAAASLLPFSLAVIGGSALAAAVQRRAGPPRLVAQRLIATGLALIAVSDALLIPLAALAWGVPLSAAVGGAGIGLSAVASTGLGTDVAARWRGGASGIINTAAQLGTAVGIATLLLVAAATSGIPAPRTPPPRAAWAVAALVAAAGAARFAASARKGARPRPVRQDAGYGGSDRVAAGGGGRSDDSGGADRG